MLYAKWVDYLKTRPSTSTEQDDFEAGYEAANQPGVSTDCWRERANTFEQELLKRAAESLQYYCAEINGDMNDGLATEIEAYLDAKNTAK